MNKTITILAALVFAFYSCCDQNTEIAQFPMSQTQLDMVPYQLNDVIPFQHSNGYNFDFIVVDYRLDFENDIECEHRRCCGIQYWAHKV